VWYADTRVGGDCRDERGGCSIFCACVWIGDQRVEVEFDVLLELSSMC
jgi:hypothetical protein